MILSELYKALLTRITGLADVKHLAYNRGQLETDEDFDHLQFPAVLVEFLPFEPKAMGQKRQGADMQIVLTIASEVVQNTDARETDTIRNLGLAHMVLLDNIHALLQGWNGLGLTPTVNFNALNRTGFSPYDGVAGLENGMLMVHTMTYTTRIIDDAALVMYELMSPQPGLEINGVYYAPIIPPTDPDPPTPPETHVIEIIAGDGIDVDASDPERPVVSNTGLLDIVEGDNVSIDKTDPQRPVVHAVVPDGGAIESVVAGDGIVVDNSDPANPEVGLLFNPDFMSLSEGWFVGSDSFRPWNLAGSTSGSGALVSFTNGGGVFNGGWFLTTGTTSNGRAHYGSVTLFAINNAITVVNLNIRIFHLADATDGCISLIGLYADNGSLSNPDGIYFKYDRTISLNWLCISRNGITETVTDTGIVVTNSSFNSFRIETNGSDMNFYYNETPVASHATDFPSSNVFFGFKNLKTSGTSARSMYMDAFWAWQKYNTPINRGNYTTISIF